MLYPEPYEEVSSEVESEPRNLRVALDRSRSRSPTRYREERDPVITSFANWRITESTEGLPTDLPLLCGICKRRSYFTRYLPFLNLTRRHCPVCQAIRELVNEVSLMPVGGDRDNQVLEELYLWIERLRVERLGLTRS